MTNQDIQYFLDVLLPYSDKQKRSKTADGRLSDAQKDRLYGIARKLCSEKILHKENAQKLPLFLKDITGMLHSMGYNQNMKATVRRDSSGNIIYAKDGNTQTYVFSGYTDMPFLIKQVLYLLSVRALQNEIGRFRQNDVLGEMQLNGIKAGHNFFSDAFGDITPARYYECIRCCQPKNPIKYMGQKRGRLGVAIKHLAMQADVSSGYDTFIDVFGGSSSATVAPIYKKKVTYIYNDLDPMLTNYVEVLASDTLYKEFSSALKRIQAIIRSGGQDYIDYVRDEVSIEEYINKFKNKNKRAIKEHMRRIVGLDMREANSEKEDLQSMQREYMQLRALKTLVLCKESYRSHYKEELWKPKDDAEKIKAASVLLVLHYFSINAEIGSDSSVTQDIPKLKKHSFEKFCEENFEELIKGYHKKIKRLETENIHNEDCSGLIKKYRGGSGKKILFYVDSPYVNTTAYKINGERWGIGKMEELINALFDSGQKFIFSMRACKDTRTDKSAHTKTQIFETSEGILGVFECFSSQMKKTKQDLYVLAADFDMADLPERIVNTQKCEIMVTNYPIQSFYEIGGKIDVDFIRKREYKAEKFDDFLNYAKGALEALEGSIDLQWV